MKNLGRTSFSIPIAALVAACIGLSSYAKAWNRRGSAFDGSWSLVVETTRGSCPMAVRAGVRILDGRVLADDPSYGVNGWVSRNGAVRVTIFAAGQSGGARGHLSNETGRGVWRTSSGDCSGKWTAERRLGQFRDRTGINQGVPSETIGEVSATRVQ